MRVTAHCPRFAVHGVPIVSFLKFASSDCNSSTFPSGAPVNFLKFAVPIVFDELQSPANAIVFDALPSSMLLFVPGS